MYKKSLRMNRINKIGQVPIEIKFWLNENGYPIGTDGVQDKDLMYHVSDGGFYKFDDNPEIYWQPISIEDNTQYIATENSYFGNGDGKIYVKDTDTKSSTYGKLIEYKETPTVETPNTDNTVVNTVKKNSTTTLLIAGVLGYLIYKQITKK